MKDHTAESSDEPDTIRTLLRKDENIEGRYFLIPEHPYANQYRIYVLLRFYATRTPPLIKYQYIDGPSKMVHHSYLHLHLDDISYEPE